MLASTFDFMMLISYGLECCLWLIATAFVMVLVISSLLFIFGTCLAAITLLAASYGVRMKNLTSGISLFLVVLGALSGGSASLLVDAFLQNLNWEITHVLMASLPGALIGAGLGWCAGFCIGRLWHQTIQWCCTRITWMDGEPVGHPPSGVDARYKITHDYP